MDYDYLTVLISVNSNSLTLIDQFSHPTNRTPLDNVININKAWFTLFLCQAIVLNDEYLEYEMAGPDSKYSSLIDCTQTHIIFNSY